MRLVVSPLGILAEILNHDFYTRSLSEKSYFWSNILCIFFYGRPLLFDNLLDFRIFSYNREGISLPYTRFYSVLCKEFPRHNASPSAIFLHETVVKPRSVNKMLKVAM